VHLVRQPARPTELRIPSSASQPSLTNNLCLSPGAGCGGGDKLDVLVPAARRPVGNITAQQAQVMRLNPVVQ